MPSIALAMLALLVDEREARVSRDPAAVGTEMLLAGAGLTSTQVAGLLGTTPGAVRMKLSRGRAKKRAAG